MVFATTSQKSLYPDQVFNYAEAVPDALVANPAVAVVAGSIEGDKPQIRVPYVSQDPTSGFVAEGAAIPDGGGQLDEVLVTTGKIATIVTQTNESASFSTASQLIAAGVSRSLVTSADNALLNNPVATTGDQLGPVGLLNTSGLTTGSVDAWAGVIDAIADMKATLGSNGGTPTGIVIGYPAEAELRKLKDTTGGVYILGNPAQDGGLSIFGLPVIVNRAMPADSLLITSASEIVAAVGSVQLAASTDAMFNSDSLVRRATWRFGARIVHPDRIGLLTINTGK